MKKRLLSLSLVLILLTSKAFAANIEFSRLAGENRYDTAVEASRDSFSASNNVIIASGESFPDALSGSSLASSLGAPILLTSKDSISSKTISEIVRLGTKRIFILGSTGSVSEEVESQLRALAPVTRLGGDNRYETSTIIAKEVMHINGKTEVGLASGANFPDALAASYYLSQNGIPIILTDPRELDPSARKFLDTYPVDKLTVFGGEGAVSSQALEGIEGVNRIAGENRFETAIEIAKAVGKDPSDLVLVNAFNFPDALSATSVMMVKGAPILLTDASELPKELSEYLRGSSAQRLTIVGGRNSVSNDIIKSIWSIDEEEQPVEKPDLENDSYNTDYANRLAELINEARQNNGNSYLAPSEELNEAARVRAKELSLTFPDTKRPDGSAWSTVSEKAKGQFVVALNAFPEDVLEYLKSLSGIFIERADLKAIGVGCYTDAEGQAYWVIIYGLE